MKFDLLKKIGCIVLASGMVFSIAACRTNEDPNNSDDPSRGSYNNATDPIVLSSQEVDGVFNPFYSSSGTDSNIAGLTQIAMLANDEDGKVVYGDDEPVVTKDLWINPVGDPETDKDNGLMTEYYFVLKNNVKFSNGSPLTIKDVLFNYYVYLDPVYTGSSTIYSTDIVGLAAYRTQQQDQNAQDAFMVNFEIAADARIGALDVALEDINKEHGDTLDAEAFLEVLRTYQQEHSYNDNNAHLVDDYQKAVELFKDELNTDYTNALDSYQDTILVGRDGTEYRPLQSDVEMFLFNEGEIYWNRNDAILETYAANSIEQLRAQNWDKDRAIQHVFDVMVPGKFSEVINYWVTASDLFTYITMDEFSAYIDEHGVDIKSVSGIEFANMNQDVEVNGTTYAAVGGNGSEHRNSDGSPKEGYNEVLKITINNIDPKAIWNFALSIAPMYYYSDAEHIAKFDYTENFGVEYGNQDWYTDVVKDQEKTGVPVGAGPYAASNDSVNGVNYEAGNLPARGEFHANNMIYFQSNPYYVGGEPLIKKLRYSIQPSSALLNNLYTNNIDFVEPNAKKETFNELDERKAAGTQGSLNVDYETVATLGYGYIGINAGLVPSLYVRQAIMHSINTQEIVNYYGSHAEPIYRSMSKESWAYPEQATSYYPYVGDPIPENLDVVNPEYKAYVTGLGLKAGDKMTKEQQVGFINYLVKDIGRYSDGGNGILADNQGNSLKITFTIVGADSDHPAFGPLMQAAAFLNKDVTGWQVQAKNDPDGLRKLNQGSLSVWAAAWSSSIDPDMYQIYHKDSKAGAVKNWGYTQILQNQSRYPTEYRIIVNELSPLIDAARETNDERSRASIYSDCLDLVMQLAVELPVYQREDLFVYNRYKIDERTFFENPSSFKGLTANIHTVSLNVAQ